MFLGHPVIPLAVSVMLLSPFHLPGERIGQLMALYSTDNGLQTGIKPTKFLGEHAQTLPITTSAMSSSYRALIPSGVKPTISLRTAALGKPVRQPPSSKHHIKNCIPVGIPDIDANLDVMIQERQHLNTH
jgi:hypothetical protein